MSARHAFDQMRKRLDRLFFLMPPRLPGRAILPAPIEGVFNPAFIGPDLAPGADLAFIARETYYTLDKRFYMVGPPDPERARNVLVGLTYAGGRYEEAFRRPVPALDQLEDVRFFRFQGRTFLLGLELHPEPGRLHGPILGELTREGDRLKARLVRPQKAVEKVEKNWAFHEEAGALWIEKWPGGAETYRVDPDSLDLTYQKWREPDRGWSGTKGAPFRGGTLFLDHRRIYLFDKGKLPIRFIFRFRHVAPNRAPVLSPLFSLHRHDALVYASDLAVEPGVARIGFGVNDAQAGAHEIELGALAAFLRL